MWSLLNRSQEFFASVGPARSRRQLAQLFRDPLFANGSFLFANTVLGSLFGFVYWIVMAKLFSASEIGLGTALVSAATLLAGLSHSGLGLGIIRFLGQTSRARGDALISASFTFSFFVALFVGTVYIFALPLWSSKLLFLQNPFWAVAFLFSVGLWALAPMIDQVFLAHRAGAAVLGRNVVMHVAKLALPFTLVFAGGVVGVYASFTLATAASCLLGLWFLAFWVRPGYRFEPHFFTLFKFRDFLLYSVGSHTANYLVSIPSLALPLIVLNRIGQTQTAYYYVAFMIASLLYSAATALATSAFVEGSSQGSSSTLKKAVKATLFIVVPGMVILHFVSPLLLGFFGHDYLEAKALLRVLIYAAPLDAAMRLLVTHWRVNKAVVTLNIFSALWAVGIVGLSLFATELVHIGYVYMFGGLPALAFGLAATRLRKL